MTALVYGLVKSSIFFLMAMGFSLVFGVTRVANFAHGALFVVGGFVTWVFLNWLGFPWWAAVIMSLFVLVLIGVALYRFCLIRVRGMEISEITFPTRCMKESLSLLKYKTIFQRSFLATETPSSIMTDLLVSRSADRK